MCTKISLNNRSRGSAIALALLSVTILSMIGVAMLTLALHGRLMGVRSSSEIAARAAADGGLTKAVFAMNQKIDTGTWDPTNLPRASFEPLPYCDAIFSYAVEGDTNDGYSITSIGKSGRYQKRVDATVRLEGLFNYGILAKESIVLKSGTSVDAYDSNDPNNSSSATVNIATTSTNSGMIVMQNSTVDGEVQTGVDYYFFSLAPPVLPNMGTNIVVVGETRIIGPADSGIYTSISLSHKAGKPGILQVSGGNVVLEILGNVNIAQIDIGQNCEIVVKQGASLVLYLAGDLIIGEGGGIRNETLVPLNMMLISTTCNANQLLALKAKTSFSGVVYAPCAQVQMNAGSDIYGAFVCDNFELKSNSTIFYDATLKDVEIGDLGARFVVDRWHE